MPKPDTQTNIRMWEQIEKEREAQAAILEAAKKQDMDVRIQLPGGLEVVPSGSIRKQWHQDTPFPVVSTRREEGRANAIKLIAALANYLEIVQEGPA